MLRQAFHNRSLFVKGLVWNHRGPFQFWIIDWRKKLDALGHAILILDGLDQRAFELVRLPAVAADPRIDGASLAHEKLL